MKWVVQVPSIVMFGGCVGELVGVAVGVGVGVAVGEDVGVGVGVGTAVGVAVGVGVGVGDGVGEGVGAWVGVGGGVGGSVGTTTGMSVGSAGSEVAVSSGRTTTDGSAATDVGVGMTVIALSQAVTRTSAITSPKNQENRVTPTSTLNRPGPHTGSRHH
jgi:hypothetical protein